MALQANIFAHHLSAWSCDVTQMISVSATKDSIRESTDGFTGIPGVDPQTSTHCAESVALCDVFLYS